VLKYKQEKQFFFNELFLAGFGAPAMELNASTKDKLIKILKEHNITKAGIYGSNARNEAN